MGRKRKRRNALILAFILSFTLCACGKGQSSEEASHMSGEAVRASEEAQTNEYGHEQISITSYRDYINEDFVNALHEIYPEINLKIVNYAGNNGSGQAQHSLEQDDMTDIYVTTYPFRKSLQPERLVDLSKYGFVNNYSTHMLNSLEVNGGIYLLPAAYTLTGICYNKTIMEENGWEVPQSFEELLALKPEIEAAGYQFFANAMDLEGYPFNYFFNVGNTVYFGTQDGVQWKEDFPAGTATAVGNQGLEEAIRYYNEWIENGIITNESMSKKEYQENGNVVFYLCLGLSNYTYETEDGEVYEFGIMPWLSRDGSNNMLTSSVERYFGINAHLEEPGNEQKLEDALHVLEFLSTTEGQSLLVSTPDTYLLSLGETEISESGPYVEVADVINSGHTVPLVYVGWEDLIVPIAQDLRSLIKGELKAEELSAVMDETCDGVLNLGTVGVFGTATETLTYEETAALCAIAEGKAADADCAMTSLNEYHSGDLYNRNGTAWYLWEGKVNTEMINIITPNGTTISVLELTGAQIKEMQAAGYDANGNGEPYEYLLFTKNGMELEDDVIYRLAMATAEVPEEMSEAAEVLEISPGKAIEDYVTELGAFGAEDISWKE